MESDRLKLLAKLKIKDSVTEDEYMPIYRIYKNNYLGRAELPFENNQSDKWRKSFKSILTSLKKMMVLKTKKPRNSLKPSKDSQRYTVNLDVK